MIDAHVHFWRPERGDYGWLTPALTPLYRAFLPEDLAPLTAAAGVRGVVAVQAAPSEAETRFLFELARAHPEILGVVGWVDLAAPDARARIAALVADGRGLLKGVRPMLQDLPDRHWVGRPELDPAFDALVAHDLAFDALVRVEHLSALSIRMARTPGLRVVIDHAAKPDVASEAFDAWAAVIAPIAGTPRVMCKLSGLLTEAVGRDPDSVDRYVRWLLKAFGPDRLIWGSDWPVLTLATDYAAWAARARALADDPRIFDGNARRFYRIDAQDSVLVLAPEDNVGVALRALAAGDSAVPGVAALSAVELGFKVALAPIAEGAKIVKYGVPIGSATRAIAAGERVHLENMRSDYTATHTRELKETLL